VSIPSPGGPAELPQLNTPEPANQGLTRHTTNFQASVGQAGAELCRTVALQD